MTALLRSTPRAAARRALAAATLALMMPGAAHGAGGGVAIGATAQSGASAPSVSRVAVRRAQTLLRTTVTGTNDPATRVVVKRFQRLRGLTPSGVITRATYREIRSAFALLEVASTGTAAGAASDAAVATTPEAGAFQLPVNLAPFTTLEQTILDQVATCESQGDPQAISPNGTYRGKYQFDRATWRTVGGSGDPAAASEAEQDQRAAILLRQRGTGPWPVCGVELS
ncbi:MAG: transglycosylase family protein [Patulibacter sp.]